MMKVRHPRLTEVRVVYWMREYADRRFTPVWRIIVGLSLIPACGTLYQRLTLQESTRFKKSQEAELPEQGDLEKEKMRAEVGIHTTESESEVDELPSVDVSKKAHFRGMVPCGFEHLLRSHKCFRGHQLLLRMETPEDTHRNLFMLVLIRRCVR
jgi:hypothetical protein